jgi:hypothetical protein
LCDQLKPEANVNCVGVFLDAESALFDSDNRFGFHIGALFIVPGDKVLLIHKVLVFFFFIVIKIEFTCHNSVVLDLIVVRPKIVLT